MILSIQGGASQPRSGWIAKYGQAQKIKDRQKNKKDKEGNKKAEGHQGGPIGCSACQSNFYLR
jgi:hypothetical protein